MPHESSTDHPELIKAQIALLEQVDAGHLNGLLCPKCKTKSVSVWFKGSERTLVKCQQCDFDSLAIITGLPKFYTSERDLYVKKELATKP